MLLAMPAEHGAQHAVQKQTAAHLHSADTITANEVAALEHSTMKAMKMRNLEATACRPTSQYTTHEKRMGEGSCREISHTVRAR